MPPPTPIHRDADKDGDDYGCVGHNRAKANAAIAVLVSQTRRWLLGGAFDDSDSVIDFIHEELKQLEHQCDCGSCDTVVKENVFVALHDAVRAAGLEPIDGRAIYGW